MITFAYTPVGASTVTTVTLLDSDRFWPASMDISARGESQVSSPVRGLVKVYYGRGLKDFQLSFPATRQHASISAAGIYCFQTIPALLGAKGTLTIAFPGGGQIRAVGSVCLAASGRYGGIRTYVDFTFAGPNIGP